MTTYIINSPILTAYGHWQFDGPISKVEAVALLQDGFVSAIGHSASADVLSNYLSIEIPVNRIQISMLTGDKALVLRLLSRLPEGKVLDHEELVRIPFELGVLTRY